MRRIGLILFFWAGIVILSGCEATAQIVIPTAIPTATATFTPSPTRTPARDATPTQRPTVAAAAATFGPSPTPLFGATRTPLPANQITPTRVFNPNAPRIEFFTSDVLSVEPGGEVTLYWSARGVDTAVIYRMNRSGERTQVFNVPPEGSLKITTRSADRGELRFLLTIGENETYTEQLLAIPLQCPVAWFFSPAPEECPDTVPEETALVEQNFERGRMIFAQGRNLIYTLFNDARTPAWLAFENRYDPAIHPEKDPNAPPQFIQPLRELGLVWRTNDTVRNRMGLGTADATSFQGFIQIYTQNNGQQQIFISSADGKILQLLPGGEIWQIISPVPIP